MTIQKSKLANDLPMIGNNLLPPQPCYVVCLPRVQKPLTTPKNYHLTSSMFSGL